MKLRLRSNWFWRFLSFRLISGRPVSFYFFLQDLQWPFCSKYYNDLSHAHKILMCFKDHCFFHIFSRVKATSLVIYGWPLSVSFVSRSCPYWITCAQIDKITSVLQWFDWVFFKSLNWSCGLVKVLISRRKKILNWILFSNIFTAALVRKWFWFL